MEKKKSKSIIVHSGVKGTKSADSFRKSPDQPRGSIKLKPRIASQTKNSFENVVQSDTTINEQPRNIYRSDGVKRLGQVKKAYQRSEDADMTLIISEVKSDDEIRGFVKDWEEYGVEQSEYNGSWYVDPNKFVFYEKRTNQDGSKNKASNLSPIRLENKSDLERLEKCIRFYYESNPVYEKYRQMLEKRLDSGNI